MMDIHQRIQTAILNISTNRVLMSIAAADTDADVVLADCGVEITRLRSELAEAHGCLSELLDAMGRYEMDVDCGPTSEHRLMMVRARRALSHRQHEPAEDAFRAGWIAAMQVCGETDIDPDTDAAYQVFRQQQERHD